MMIVSIYSFFPSKKYLLSAPDVPSIILGTEDTELDKTDKV